MKKRIITASAALFLLVGAVLLIAPRIANQIGKEEAHSAIEQFEELKGGIEQTNPATEPTNAAKKPNETNTTMDVVVTPENNIVYWRILVYVEDNKED